MKTIGEEWFGWCDCDGHTYHDHPCAHLFAVARRAIVSPSFVPEVDKAMLKRARNSIETVEPDIEPVDEALEDDQDDIDEDDDPDPAPVEVPSESDDTDPEPPTRVADSESRLDPSAVESPDTFVEEIAGVPEAFVVEMGGSPYVTKEGLSYLANQQNLSVRSEPLSPSWEDDAKRSVFRGVVTDDDGREWVDIGTASLEHEDLANAKANLDELASTRATNRALRLATGCGFASMEELEVEPRGD